MTPPPPPPSPTPPPPPPPPSESDEGESGPEASLSISLTQGGLRSTWKSAEILQLLETSKRARLMKNGSTWGLSNAPASNSMFHDFGPSDEAAHAKPPPRAAAGPFTETPLEILPPRSGDSDLGGQQRGERCRDIGDRDRWMTQTYFIIN
ncbi:hypothetical protein EYF80_043479 [Liparis tanakae]|uniref:Uncharacterized protein n=1 Tax=Liparis tanakae TaxID=230148 RepID=A0A4Z2FZM1_9TELE|nr:hypothetical protein EYF80_043479 [Liparis tanakae]